MLWHKCHVPTQLKCFHTKPPLGSHNLCYLIATFDQPHTQVPLSWHLFDQSQQRAKKSVCQIHENVHKPFCSCLRSCEKHWQLLLVHVLQEYPIFKYQRPSIYQYVCYCQQTIMEVQLETQYSTCKKPYYQLIIITMKILT